MNGALLTAGWLAMGSTLLAGPAIALDPAGAGVFLGAEAVEIPVRTPGESVRWTATDYWGKQAAGDAPVQNGAATIRPGLGRNGYFDLHLSARDASGGELAQADTAFAVLRPPPGPARLAESRFGVMTHFAQGWNTDLMPLLAKAGIGNFRDEQYWQEVETKRASYVFPPLYRDYMAAAAANGLRPLVEMTFANTRYDHDPDAPANAWAPHTEEGRNGYADYGKALIERYGRQITALEIWNEYNGTWCPGPAAADRPAFYTAMLKTAYSAIKAARPDVTVLGGAAVLAPLPWFEDLFAHGALDAMDGVVIHPYRDRPEGVETEVAALIAAMKTANRGVAKPVWATECSSSGDAEPARRASARYLARLMTLLRASGVARIYWYLGKDYAGFTTGLLHDEHSPLGRYAPTATYAAYSALIGQLNGASPVRREPGTDPRTRVYLFQRGAEEVRVAWTVGPPARLVLAAPGPLAVTNLMGETATVAPVEGSITRAIDESPIYLAGKVTGVRETGRADALAGDSAEDFGGEQGGGGWSYGYFEAGGPAYDPAGFRPMAWTRGAFAYEWRGPHAFLSVTPEGMHPGASGDGKPVWAVRRWQSRAAGQVRVTGTLAAASEGDGVGARIFRDGKEVYAAALGGASNPGAAACDLTLTVDEGTRLDFSLTPGPGADIRFDSTTFRVQITRPLPAGAQSKSR